MAISNSLILLYKIAALRLRPKRSLRSRGGPLRWIPKALAMLVGQALACMQRSGVPEMQRSGVPEHYSVVMTVIYELIRGSLDMIPTDCLLCAEGRG